MSRVALPKPKSLRQFLLVTPRRWPDGRSMSTLDDRRASVFAGFGMLVACLLVWFVGRTGQFFGEVELDRRVLPPMILFTGLIVSFAIWARTRRSARFAVDASPQLWSPPRWSDGLRVGPNEDLLWDIAQLALVFLAVFLIWSAGRVGVPTQAGHGTDSAVLTPFSLVGLSAIAAWDSRMRRVARQAKRS